MLLTPMRWSLTAIGLALLLMAPGTLATAQPAATPAAPTAAVPASEIRVTDQREIATPGRIYAISPDGRWLAGSGEDGLGTLCVYPVETPDTPHACVDLASEGVASIDHERVAWSPDGSRLAFTENGAVFFQESDLWVFEAESGALTNLTDDGVEGGIRPFSGEADQDPFAMDLLPAWAPDGAEIVFVRSAWRDGEWQGTSLMRVPATGGDAEEVLQVTTVEPFVVYFRMAFTPDGQRLVYTRAHPDRENRNNGVWIVDRDGGNARHVGGEVDPERGHPVLVDVSPAGELAIVADLRALGGYTPQAARSLLDLEDRTIEPIEILDPGAPDYAFARYATFSPDGTKLLYQSGLTATDARLYVRDIGGEEYALLDVPGATGTTALVGPVWLENGTVFVPTAVDGGVLLTVEPPLSRPALATSATPAAEPVASPTAGGPVDPAVVEIGTGLVVNDAVAAVRSAPSSTAQVVAELEQGAEVVAIGPAEAGDGFVWIPIRDPATGTIGYVRAELLSPTEGAPEE